MAKLANFSENVLANIVAEIVILVATIAVGWLIAFYTNDPQTGLLSTLTILLLLNVALTLLLLRRQAPVLREQNQKLIIFREGQSSTHFLTDVYGRAREIPDESTRSFLAHALRISGEIPTKATVQIDAIRGERLISIKDWESKRPRTPEEQARLDLWHEVNRVLRKTASDFVDDSYPHRIIVKVSNSGNKPLFVKKVRLQHENLLAEDLDTSYPKEGIHTIVSPDPSKAIIAPKGDLVIELRLSHWLERSKIELHKGQWGWLWFDLTCDAEPVDEIAIQI